MGWYYSHGLIIIYRVVIRLHTYVHTYHRATSCLQSLAQDLQYLVNKNEGEGEKESEYGRKDSKRNERERGQVRSVSFKIS